MRVAIFYTIMLIFLGCKSNKYDRKFKKVNMHDRIVEAYFIDDSIIDGLAKYYTYTGYLDSKITYLNGVKTGNAVNYYPNGNIWDSSFYINGKKHGNNYVFDSLGRLIYQDYYFYGQSLGGKTFFKDDRVKRYVFDNFEQQQLYEGLYDSSGRLFRYGGEIINATLSHATKDDIPGHGVFAYFLQPPNVSIKYSLGLIEDKTNERKELVVFEKNRVFIDTIMDEPNPDLYYYIAADYNDTVSKYHKVFLTVLK